MKLVRLAALLCLLIVCNNVFGQSLKITSVGPSFKPIAPMIVGKKMELVLSKDSAFVSVIPLHQKVNLKQVAKDQYLHIDSTESTKDTYLLTVYKIQDQVTHVKLEMVVLTNKGDKTEGWIIAKP